MPQGLAGVFFAHLWLQGTALCSLAGIQLRREDALEAEKTAKERQKIL